MKSELLAIGKMNCRIIKTELPTDITLNQDKIEEKLHHWFTKNVPVGPNWKKFCDQWWIRQSHIKMSNSNLNEAAERSLRLIGYWKNDRYPQLKNYPDPKNFVDENWNEEHRQKVIEYLDNGVYYVGTRGISRCRFCHCGNGSSELTDGVFFWPEGLSHYLKEHHVRLPQHFVKHCLNHHYDKAEVEQAIKEHFDKGIGLMNHREDWWKTFRSFDTQQFIEWEIEPHLYDDEENTLVATGFWEGDECPFGEANFKYPHPKFFIDENWDKELKEKVVAYMKTCTEVTSEPLNSHDQCLFTGKPLSNKVLCDGHFLFPENYIHYIENHNVRPVNYFVHHCLKNTNTWIDDISSVDYDLEMDWWEDFKVY